MRELEAAGLSAADVDEWRARTPGAEASFAQARKEVCAYLARGTDLRARLPFRATRNDAEHRAAEALSARLDDARATFLRVHIDDVYRELTDGLRRPVRDEELVYAAAERFPGLTPTRAQIAEERARTLPEKEGAEIAQGLFLSYVLASPRSGAHLVWSMLRPTETALERLEDFRATGVADLGGTYLERRGSAGYLATTVT